MRQFARFLPPWKQLQPELITCVLSYSGYFISNRWPGLREHAVPATWLDRRVKLQPWTVYCYISLYPLLVLQLIWWSQHPLILARLLRTITRANCWSTVCFMLYRTSVARDSIPDATQCGAGVLAWLRQHDQPYNAFPSLHTAYALIIWRYTKRYQLQSGPIIGVWCWAIIVSTLTTKQHHLYDVVGGLVLASVCDM